jgi:hypothetical protein
MVIKSQERRLHPQRKEISEFLRKIEAFILLIRAPILPLLTWTSSLQSPVNKVKGGGAAENLTCLVKPRIIESERLTTRREPMRRTRGVNARGEGLLVYHLSTS